MQNKIYKISFKFAAVVLMTAVSVGTLNISTTNAFYNDNESSTDNTFQAAMLDFRLTNNNLNKIIGPEALGEISHASVAMPESGSLAMQYTLFASTTNDVSLLCSKLIVETKQNGITKYLGPLSGLAGATTTDFGTWEFRFDLPVTASAAHGDICGTDAIFSAWRADVVEPSESGWYDEETLNISFTARMVVLNEIYASPKTGDKEFIELYNNGSTPVDVLGWKISEISGDAEKLYTISTDNLLSKTAASQSGSTVIPANGFLAFYLSDGTALNNTGDTVKLYQNSILLDSHTYPSIVAGKSVVRFPDGIGFWVDPEPTPGTSNTVSLDDLRAAGFDDYMIAQVIELALVKNAIILTAMQGAETPIETTATSTASTTPEILRGATGAPETEIVIDVIEADNSEGESLPPFKEEEMAVKECQRQPLTLDDLVATTTLENITEVSSTTPEVIVEPAVIPPEPEESAIGESEPTLEPEPVVEPDSTSSPQAEPVVEPEPAIVPEIVVEPEITNE